jgi:hypothetical protein
MRRVNVAMKKFAIFIHRWMGVAFCLLFMWWFISGIFMMYWGYPTVTELDRLSRAPALDPDGVKLSPAEAYATMETDDPPTSVRLTSFDGRPAYYFRFGRGSATVYADDGKQQEWFPPDMMLRTAAAWAGLPAESAKHELLEEEDQWTIQSGLRSLLPLHKYVFPDGQHVYISDNTGEVVQYTTTSSRIYAHLGAIPHWLYYTPLRKHGLLWTRVVVWSSAIATVAALLGLVVGIWMLSPKKKYRHEGAPTMIPYRGQKRLHTILGLTFGVLAMTWAFSGMLSMDPFPEFFNGPVRGQAKARGFGKGKGKAASPAGRLEQALTGGRFQMARYAAKHPAEALLELKEFKPKQLEFTSYAGEPVYLASNGEGETRLIPVEPMRPEQFGAGRILSLARSSAGEQNIAEARILDKYDLYYLDRTGRRPLPVVYVRLKDETSSRFYIDPDTGRIVGRYSNTARSWVNRWLYHALHSIDLPWLYNYRPAWDIVVLALMLACTWLCWTSMVLSWRVLKRKFAPARARRTPSEDLAVAGKS